MILRLPDAILVERPAIMRLCRTKKLCFVAGSDCMASHPYAPSAPIELYVRYRTTPLHGISENAGASLLHLTCPSPRHFTYIKNTSP